MKIHKWYTPLIIGLALILSASLAACNKSEESPYAPDFTLQTINGETVSLSDFSGKPVMLTFWNINCAACQFQMPYIQAFYDEWSSETIAVLTINVGDSISSAQNYVTSQKLTFPVLLDTREGVTQTYGIPGVPTTFLIDSDGILKAYKIGAFQSQQEMEDSLKSMLPSLVLTPKLEIGAEIGNAAPDFTLQTTDGQSITLSKFRGKTVLLNFWVSSCTPCVTEMPYFQTVFDEQTNEELAIVAINCEEPSQTVQNIVDDLGLTFHMLLDPDGKVCTDYKRGAPTAFLIDSNGIIKAIRDEVFQNPEEIEIMLDSM
ncbi:MAG: redoxin domain-containing protein [Chloroflexi bacterium]|nr:redoxin domain-containing protein [Chloroflexota bacterium]MBL7061818.1 redoxin domain-containing protein [Dehalococcoidia bacterium]